MYKKLLALLATGCLCLSSSMSVMAEGVDSKHKLNEIKISKITAAIRFVEDDKAAYELKDVDFKTFELGAGITTYEYKNGDFCELGEIFPIFADGSIVASVMNIDDESYCVETSLAHNINSINCVEAAIVYDRDEVYLFYGSDFVLLRKSGICVPGRDDIDDALGYPYIGEQKR